MAGKSFLRNIAGRITEILGIQTSAGAPNAGDIPALDSTGRLDVSMMPVGIAPEVQVVPTSDDLAAGNWVNLYSNGGTLTARKADATTAGKEADGFVLAATLSPANATVYLEGNNTQCAGLTKGEYYYLSAVAGGQTTTAPSTTGNVIQRLGKAVSATEMTFEPGEPITVA